MPLLSVSRVGSGYKKAFNLIKITQDFPYAASDAIISTPCISLRIKRGVSGFGARVFSSKRLAVKVIRALHMETIFRLHNGTQP